MLTNDCRVLLIGSGEHTGLLRAFIAQNDFDVIHVHNADDARTALRILRLDLVLIDCDDTDAHGREIVDQIEVGIRLPIIVLTYYRLNHCVRQQLSQLGVTWVLQKPIVIASLPELITYTIAQQETIAAISSSRYVNMCDTASAMLQAI